MGLSEKYPPAFAGRNEEGPDRYRLPGLLRTPADPSERVPPQGVLPSLEV